MGAATICTAAGAVFSAILKRRCTVLRETASILDEMQTKIRYRSTRMTELISEISAESAFAGNEFIAGAAAGMRSGLPVSEAWIRAADTAPFYSESDRDILKNIGSGLGNSDTEGQLSQLALGSSMLGRALEEAERECAGKSRMLISVWTLCGIGAGIIII